MSRTQIQFTVARHLEQKENQKFSAMKVRGIKSFHRKEAVSSGGKEI